MANPALVQSVSSNGADANSLTKLRIELPNDSLSGNCIAVFVSSDKNGVAPTVSDDKSNTYTSINTTQGTGQRGTWLVSLNSTAGVRLVDINFSSACAFASAAVSEWTNVATSSAADGNNGNSGSGTSLTSGSFTTAVDGDLILAGFIQDTDNNAQTNFTPGSGFSVLMHDRWNSTCFVEYKIQSTHAAINPDATMSPTHSWIGVGIALKNATAGTSPGSGIRIQRYQHNGINQAGGSSLDIFLPSSGNLLALKWNDPSARITAISDTASNTWTIGTSVTDTSFGNAGENQICYAVNATPSNTLKLTLTLNATFGAFICITLDIVNADPAPFVQTTSAHGANTTTTSTAGASITPTSANHLIIALWGIDSASCTAVSSGQLMTNLPTPAIASPSAIDQNNGFVAQLSPSTSTITHTWTTDAAPNSWAEVIAEFKALSATAKLRRNSPLDGLGASGPFFHDPLT